MLKLSSLLGNDTRTTSVSFCRRAHVPSSYRIHARSCRYLLFRSGPSSSGFVQRISLEQAEIQSRLVDLVGVEGLRSTLQGTHLDADGSSSMMVDGPKPISAKQRALEQFVCHTGSRIILFVDH
jgi:hypothetical protein